MGRKKRWKFSHSVGIRSPSSDRMLDCPAATRLEGRARRVNEVVLASKLQPLVTAQQLFFSYQR